MNSKQKNKTIEFTKVVGAGNDFIIVDNRRSTLPRKLARLAQQVCDRRRGIGADGLLVAERSRQGDIAMRIFNPDGSEAEMCGNGARCFALYAYAQQLAPRRMRLETRAGVLEAHVLSGARVRLEMPLPTRFGRAVLRVAGRTVRCHLVQIGNPHAVIIVKDLNRTDVVALGRMVRRHPRFAPDGTNVNFLQPSRSLARIRTYERGVEDETPACGTGATASAMLLWKYFGRRSPVTLATRSGDRLRISWHVVSGRVQRVFLNGAARIVFTGQLTYEGS